MYYYMICDYADEAVFWRQVEILKERIPGLVEDAKLLEDVDGTLVQSFYTPLVPGGGRLKLVSDVQINYVNIKSTFDIDPYFE